MFEADVPKVSYLFIKHDSPSQRQVCPGHFPNTFRYLLGRGVNYVNVWMDFSVNK